MHFITKPLSAQIELTDKCNLKCPHCYLFDFKDSTPSRDISEAQITNIINTLIKENIFSITLTGGEPLLRKSVLHKIIPKLYKSNINTSLNTNLLALTKPILDLLQRYRISHLLVSCPSTDSQEYKRLTGGGKLNRFLHNLSMLSESNLRFSVNMVVNAENINSIRQTAIYLKDYKIRKFGATPMGLNVENPRKELLLSKKQIELLFDDLLWIQDNLNMQVDIFEALPKCIFPERVIKRNPSFINRNCQAGRTTFTISNNGDVRPCSHNPDIYGNILTDTIEAIWERMHEWRENSYTPVSCISCNLEYKCHGGCRTTARAFTNNPCGLDPWMTSPPNKIATPSEHHTPTISINSKLEYRQLLRTRKEGNSYFLIVGTNGLNKPTIVNKELLRFIEYLYRDKPTIVSEITSKFNIDINDLNFQRILAILQKRSIVTIIN